MENPYDQFDEVNPYDQFDAPQTVPKKNTSPADTRTPRARVPLGGAISSGGAEAALNFITGGMAAPVAGWAGILAAGTNALGITNKPAADVVREVQDGLTYQPRFAEGQRAAELVGKPFELLARSGDWTGQKAADFTGSPAVGAGVNAAVQFAPAVLLSKGLKGRTPKPAEAAARAEQYVSTRTGVAWADIPEGIKARLTEVAKDATVLDSLDPVALERHLKLQSLDRPVPATAGQLTRDPVQLRNEGNVASTEAGKAVRDIHVQQNKALLDNLEVLTEKQRGKAGSPEQVGSSIQGAARAKLKAQEAKVSKLYKAADTAGETSVKVDVTPILDMMEATPDVTHYGWAQSWFNKMDADKPGTGLTIRQLEDLRQAAQVKLQSADGPTRHYARKLVNEIDAATEGKGGDLYKQARAARKAQAMEFDEQKGVLKLVDDKTRTDPAVALEKTWKATVIDGSIQDLRNVKKTLLSSKEGVQAWREVRAETGNYLIREATKRGTKYENSVQEITPAAFRNAVKSIGEPKLREILGAKDYAKLTRIMDAVEQVKTLPPDSFRGSSTMANALTFIENMAGKVGGSLGRGAASKLTGLYESGEAATTARAAQRTPVDTAVNSLYQRRGRNNLLPAAAYAVTDRNKD